MSNPSHTSTGLSIADLGTLIKRDLEASSKLQLRLYELRRDIRAGKKPGFKKIDLMEASNKDMTKDIVLRIEQIESSETSATDREMLQALNARLVVCDLQASRLIELSELERESRGEQHEFLGEEPSVGHTQTALASPTEHTKDLLMAKEHPIAHTAFPNDDEATLVQDHDSGNEAKEKPSWQVPNRVLGIPPSTSDEDMGNLVAKAMASLAVKHDPERLPNDAEAPQRWSIIESSRDMLIHTERRRFMDTRARLPQELRDVDLERLDLG